MLSDNEHISTRVKHYPVLLSSKINISEIKAIPIEIDAFKCIITTFHLWNFLLSKRRKAIAEETLKVKNNFKKYISLSPCHSETPFGSQIF